MAQRPNILEELKELESTLAREVVKQPYTVPGGYFERLPQLLLARIREESEISGLVQHFPKENPYMVPEGYFESLETRVQVAISRAGTSPSVREELQDIAPLLSTFDRKTPYLVPEGYFDTVNLPVPSKVKNSKLVSIGASKLFRYAAAAVVTGLVAVTVLLLSGPGRLDPSENSYSWVEKKMKKVSTNEIENFVALASETITGDDMLAGTARSNEIKAMMEDISSKEIQAFLSDLPQDEVLLEDEAILN